MSIGLYLTSYPSLYRRFSVISDVYLMPHLSVYLMPHLSVYLRLFLCFCLWPNNFISLCMCLSYIPVWYHTCLCVNLSVLYADGDGDVSDVTSNTDGVNNNANLLGYAIFWCDVIVGCNGWLRWEGGGVLWFLIQLYCL